MTSLCLLYDFFVCFIYVILSNLYKIKINNVIDIIKYKIPEIYIIGNIYNEYFKYNIECNVGKNIKKNNKPNKYILF
jgi:hypothetical protein